LNIAIEAVPEDDVLGLVRDLRREKELRLLVGGGDRKREQLDRDPVLGDEELGEAEAQELPLLVGEHVGVRPLARVLGEVEVLGGPVLALPAREELLVGWGRFDDAVEARHHLVDVAVEEDLQGLVLGIHLGRAVSGSVLGHSSSWGG
jgi:hypothetical protein